ncbi:MAG: pilus (MSHA type) biogenesis protein MshL, partial [Pontibacterium sp.]
ASIQTKVFHLNYLDVERDGSSDTQVSSGSVSDTVSGASDSSGSSDTGTTSSSSTVGTRISTRSSTNFWGNLEKTLTALVTGEDRAVVISPHTGMVIVRGLPSELAIVEDYLQQAELILHRQVVLEAKILEITLSEAFRTGVNWTALSTNGSGETFSIEQVADSIASTGLGGIFRTSANINDFTAVIELLGRQGDVQVLSSPRVSTINNQKAVIKVGNDEYFVTEVETTTTTGDTTTTTPSIEFTPFFSGIALDVTPQISGDGDIVLHIHPTVSDVVDQQKDINIGTEDYSIPLAFSSIRESDSIVRAESGQIIVIGGLMKSESDKDREGVSGLQDVPLFGNLFKQRSETSEKTELVILLRPVLATDDVWQDELRRSLDTMREMRSESEQRKR